MYLPILPYVLLHWDSYSAEQFNGFHFHTSGNQRQSAIRLQLSLFSTMQTIHLRKPMAKNKRQRLKVKLLLFGILLFVPYSSAIADNAVVLPKGFFYFQFEDRYYLPTDQRYNSNGDLVSLGTDFSRNLNSQLFPALAPLNPLVGGNASFGSSEVNITQHYNQFRPLLAYGLTDRLTLGVIIPYIWASNDVNASINTSTANVGFNQLAISPANPLGVVPLAAPIPGTRRATVQDINNLLASQFGIKPVQSWSGSGIGDIEFGGRYQYYRSEYWRLAFTGIAVAPTGKQDDPDNLVDIPLGDGNWAARFQFQQDFVYQPEGLSKRLGFPGAGNFYINTFFEYLYNSPDSRVVRVCSPRQPVCNQKDEVTRKAGDIFEGQVMGYVGVYKGVILSGGVDYTHQLKSSYSGSRGLNYGDLAIDSEHWFWDYMVGLTYTTVPMFIQKEFPLPLSAVVQWRDRFEGTNVIRNRWLSFFLTAYF